MYPQQPAPAPAEAIRRAESQLGIALPASIVRLLSESNGRVVDDSRVTHEEWTVLPVRDHSTRRRQATTAEDVVWHTQRARADGDVPADAVVVARAWTAWNRLIVLPDPADPRRLGDALYRQVGMGDPLEVAGSIDDLGRPPTPTAEALPRLTPDPAHTRLPTIPGTCPECGRPGVFVFRCEACEQRLLQTDAP